MEQTIIDIIDKKAQRQYVRMTETRRKAYRAMLYAGVQITINGYSVREIAPEIDYSESGTSKLVQKWTQLMQEGDITVNLIITAIQRLPKSKRFHRVNPNPTEPAETVKENVARPLPIRPLPVKTKVKNVLGFLITPEDEMRERAAIRASILFFQSYGKGREPRLHGEYYTPGTNPDETIKDEGKWLPLDSAALYCGCKEEVINVAGQNGIIERRIYRRNASRNYYEYKIDDLDRFIRDNHLT
ncbi:MAG: hypothetical protein HDR88_10085 [Bacteroides sp.]|nr:hypothetical protein [Bacteroides sp.]